MLITKVKKTIRKYHLLNKGDRVLVAVSGGPDSVCLLSVLQMFAKELDLTLHIAHLNHLFRGRESADDERFVAALAQKTGIPATIEQVDVPAFCRERGISAQEGAREVRYAFLDKVARSVEASRIATGHTATDQAETILMRLLRGAGISGLSAIPPKRGDIIRPLIESTRQEILAYLDTAALPFVSDSSNAKPVYTRNRIRMELLPMLKGFNPRIVETLALEAALIRDENEAMQSYLDDKASDVFMQENDKVVIKRTEFNNLLPAFRRRILKKTADICGVDSLRMSVIQIEQALLFMAETQTGRTMNLSPDLTIEREYDRFLVMATGATEVFSHAIAMPGLTEVPELGIEIEIAMEDPVTPILDRQNYRWQAVFDYDKMGLPLTVRSRRPGDVFCPSGMGGRHKKLQDYLVDEKIPRRHRDSVPLLCAGDDIVWVLGFRTDERFLPGPHSQRVMTVRVRGKER
jgi:tRNA(Ile)-lysidine synthase